MADWLQLALAIATPFTSVIVSAFVVGRIRGSESAELQKLVAGQAEMKEQQAGMRLQLEEMRKELETDFDRRFSSIERALQERVTLAQLADRREVFDLRLAELQRSLDSKFDELEKNQERLHRSFHDFRSLVTRILATASLRTGRDWMKEILEEGGNANK